MLSFIITLTYMGSPVLFRFVNENNLATYSFEVSALNNRSFPAFTMQFADKQWRIVSPVPDEMLGLEPKLGVMISAYLEGIVGPPPMP
jgi:hypothetical protein